MGSNQDGPTGPDLTQGIPQDQVADGGSLAGQVGGEAVLLVRRGGEWFAIGGGLQPLQRPACRRADRRATRSAAPGTTPASASAPGKRSVRPRSTTSPASGRASGAGRSTSPARRSRPRGPAAEAPTPDSVVIVGGGAAGDSAAETLRREGYDGPITIVDPDPDAPYDRPNCSKDYLAGNASEDWLPLQPAGLLPRAQGIERLRGRRVTALEPRPAGPARRRRDPGVRRAPPRHRAPPRSGSARTWTEAARRSTTSASLPTAGRSSRRRRRRTARGGSRRELHRARGGRLAAGPQARGARRGAGRSAARSG